MLILSVFDLAIQNYAAFHRNISRVDLNESRREILEMNARPPLPIIPEDIRYLFDKRPIVFGESDALYEALLSRVAVAVSPNDVVDWLYVKDIVDFTWEIERLRRIHTATIENELESSLARLLVVKQSSDLVLSASGASLPSSERKLARAFFSNQSKAKREVTSILAKKGLEFDIDSLMAKAFSRKIEILEILGRMMASVEGRRDKTLREIDRRRSYLSIALRGTLENENSRISHVEHSKTDLRIDKRPTAKKEGVA